MIGAMSQVITFLKSFESDEQRNSVITASQETDVIELSSKVYDLSSYIRQLRKLAI